MDKTIRQRDRDNIMFNEHWTTRQGEEIGRSLFKITSSKSIPQEDYIF